jgi:hypothetical protein
MAKRKIDFVEALANYISYYPEGYEKILDYDMFKDKEYMRELRNEKKKKDQDL